MSSPARTQHVSGGSLRHTSSNEAVNTEGCSSPKGPSTPGVGSSSMKEKKRQQILAIAQKEAAEYEKYKENRRVKCVNEKPEAIGGALSREEALKKYEHQIKSEKYRAKVKRGNYKEEQKRIEEEEIQKKKEAARIQAEKNALLEKKRHEKHLLINKEEARRNRLKYFDKVNSSPNQNGSSSISNSSGDENSISTGSRNADVVNDRSALEIDQSVSAVSLSDEISSRDDDISKLIDIFPFIDCELLRDVYLGNNCNFESTLQFFQA